MSSSSSDTTSKYDAFADRYPTLDMAHPYNTSGSMQRPANRTVRRFVLTTTASFQSSKSQAARNFPASTTESSMADDGAQGPQAGPSVPSAPSALQPGDSSTGWRVTAPQPDVKGRHSAHLSRVSRADDALGKGKARADIEEEHGSGSSSDSDVPHVRSGIGAFLQAEAARDAKNPPPPPKDYGRVPVDFYKSSRGVTVTKEQVLDLGPIVNWNTYTLYNAASTFNRYSYQKAELHPQHPYIYSSPIAFKNMQEFEERQTRVNKSIHKLEGYLKDDRIPTALTQADFRRIIQSLKDVRDEEKDEMIGDRVIGHLDGLLAWVSSLHLKSTGRPFYYVCYGRQKMSFRGSAHERELSDPRIVGRGKYFPNKSTQDKALSLTAIEYDAGARPVHAIGIRAQFTKQSQTWEFRIFDSNYITKSESLYKYKPDNSNAMVRKLASIEGLGGLVKQSIEAIKNGFTSSGQTTSTKSNSYSYTIERNGGGNRPTKNNPTGLCVQLSMVFVLQSAFADLGESIPENVQWDEAKTQRISYIG